MLINFPAGIQYKINIESLLIQHRGGDDPGCPVVGLIVWEGRVATLAVDSGLRLFEFYISNFFSSPHPSSWK